MRWSGTAERSGISRSRSKRAHGRRKTSTCRVRRGGGQLEVTSDPAGARVTMTAPRSVRRLSRCAISMRPVTSSPSDRATQSSIEPSTSPHVGRGSWSAGAFVSLAGGPRSAGFFEVESPLSCASWKTASSSGCRRPRLSCFVRARTNSSSSTRPLKCTSQYRSRGRTGKTARLKVPAPNGTLWVNASPWAEVYVDGKSIGVTPLAKSRCPWAVVKSCGGIRSLVRNGRQYGGTQTPTRLSVDFKK